MPKNAVWVGSSTGDTLSLCSLSGALVSVDSWGEACYSMGEFKYRRFHADKYRPPSYSRLTHSEKMDHRRLVCFLQKHYSSAGPIFLLKINQLPFCWSCKTNLSTLAAYLNVRLLSSLSLCFIVYKYDLKYTMNIPARGPFPIPPTTLSHFASCKL